MAYELTTKEISTPDGIAQSLIRLSGYKGVYYSHNVTSEPGKGCIISVNPMSTFNGQYLFQVFPNKLKGEKGKSFLITNSKLGQDRLETAILKFMGEQNN